MSVTTVRFPSVTVTESLVQVTVVAGPPVEIHFKMNVSDEVRLNMISLDIVTIPVSKVE